MAESVKPKRTPPSGMGTGTWTPTGHNQPAFLGLCERSGHTVPAVNLELVQIPFKSGQMWACRVRCDRA